MDNDMVQIWYYDIENGGVYTGTDVVPANHVLQVGETFIRPEDGLYWPIYFVADKQRWIGTPKEQWLKEHPQPKPEPDPQQVALAGLLKDVATIKNDKSQDSLNAGLMKQVADLKITNAMKQVAQLKISNATQKQINANAMKDIALMKIQLAKLTTPTAPSQSTTVTQPTAITQPTQPSLSVSASQSASTQASQPVTTTKEEQ